MTLLVGRGLLKKAIQMKRNWIISEISKEYCDITEKRIKPYLQQLTLAI